MFVQPVQLLLFAYVTAGAIGTRGSSQLEPLIHESPTAVIQT